MNSINHTITNIRHLIHRTTLQVSMWILAVLSLFPQAAFAQGRNTFQGLVARIYDLLASLVPLIISLTLVYFLWGIFKLVQSNSEDARKDAINIITFGVIALFVMVSVWGFVAILSNTFFGGQVLLIPQLR